MTVQNIKIRPDFERLIPPLSPEEFSQLEQNILSEGIRDPLVVWNGVLVDGHNRYRIAQKHGLVFDVVRMDFADDEEAKDWMDKNQLGRRNLNPDQFALLVGRRYNRAKNKHGGDRKSSAHFEHLKTADAIASEYNIGQATVRRNGQFHLAAEAVAEAYTGDKERVNEIIGELIPTKQEVIALGKIAEESPDAVKEIIGIAHQHAQTDGGINGRKITDNGNKVSIKNAIREYRKKQESEKSKDIEITHELIDFRLGDFMDELSSVPDGSIDLIVTDPPYPFEYIDQWSRLSAFAARVLKPGGFCIAYSGHMHLPNVMQRLSEHLDYYWTFCLIHTGFSQFLTPRNLYVGWKPILIFQNGFSLFKPDKEPEFDLIDGSGKAKFNHAWQQGEDELNRLIEYFSNAGETICDPFAGSGTTLLKAAKMKRKAIGCEIDEQHYNAAKKRISDGL